MESLLRWGIENSTPGTSTGNGDASPAVRRDLDPGIIDMILGKSDVELMKEAFAIAVDEQQDEDARVEALDNLEMLVENIDNANNLEKLKMWSSLHNLLSSPSSSISIKVQTLWVIGTAMQNNPAAQYSYLSFSPLPTIVSFLSSSSAEARSKALYTLSGLLKHNSTAVKQLTACDGWRALKSALEDSSIGVRRKTVFLLNTLLTPSSQGTTETDLMSTANLHTSSSEQSAPVHPNSHASMLSDPSSTATSAAALQALDDGLLSALISSLISPVPHGPDGESEGDPDFEEKVVRLLHTYATQCGADFSPDQKRDLRNFFIEQSEKHQHDRYIEERHGLTENEYTALRRALE